MEALTCLLTCHFDSPSHVISYNKLAHCRMITTGLMDKKLTSICCNSPNARKLHAKWIIEQYTAPSFFFWLRSDDSPLIVSFCFSTNATKFHSDHKSVTRKQKMEKHKSFKQVLSTSWDRRPLATIYMGRKLGAVPLFFFGGRSSVPI